LPNLQVHTPPLLQVELEKDGWEYADMLWCQGAQNIGYPTVHRIVTMHTRPRQTDRWADRRTDGETNMAI